MAGLYRSPLVDLIAAFTYVLEGAFFHMEKNLHRTASKKAYFVAYSSYALFIATFIRSVCPWNLVEGWSLSEG